MDDMNVLSIEDFNGGISPTTNKGIRGSFAFGYGLNIRENNTLTCNQALKKDSSNTVVDLVLTVFKGSDGAMYAFGDTGKIYRKATSGSAWVLKHTDSDGIITGACEFKSTSNSYILYATRTKLKRITMTNAAGTWSGNITEVGTFTNGIAGDYHTMRVAIGVVIVADGDLLALYDYEDAVNMAALRMSTGTKAKALLDRNDRVIVGGKENQDGKFITWDRLADSWLLKKSAQGPNVNAMGYIEQGIVAQVGDHGALKYWNFGDTYPFMTIPGTANAYPGAITEYQNITHIGMNGGTKNGVYSVGRINLNDPKALNLEYIPSHGKLTATEIGALGTDGDLLYVSWKDGSTYGIDVIDTANKATGRYESLELTMSKSNAEKLLRHIKAVLQEDLPDNCEVNAWYRTNRQLPEEAAVDVSGWIACETSAGDDTVLDGESKAFFNAEGIGEKIEIALDLIPSGNTAPEISDLHLYFDFNNSI